MLRWLIMFASRAAGLMLVLTGFGAVALAVPAGPEIDPASASSAIALLVGVALLARDKFRRQ